MKSSGTEGNVFQTISRFHGFGAAVFFLPKGRIQKTGIALERISPKCRVHHGYFAVSRSTRRKFPSDSRGSNDSRNSVMPTPGVNNPPLIVPPRSG